jgi:hypothetical protein
MPVFPLVILGGSVGLSLATEYGIGKLTGSRPSRADYVGAGVLGALPGIGLVRPVGKIASSGRHLIHYDRSVDTMRGVSMGYIQYNKSNIGQIGSGVIRTQLIQAGIDRSIPSRGKTQSYQQSKNSSAQTTRILGAKRYTAKKSPPRKLFSRDARRKTSYCESHKKYDFCKYYNK